MNIDKQFDYDVSNVEHKFNVGDMVYKVTNIDSVIGGDVPRISKGKVIRVFLHWGNLKYNVKWKVLDTAEQENYLSPTEEDAPAIALKNEQRRRKYEIARNRLELIKINELLENEK